jgi:hypothetical protein
MEEAQRGDTRMGVGVRVNAWFGSGKAALALAEQGYKAVLQIKTGLSLYPKNYIETVLEGAPGGVWIVLEAVYQGTPLAAIGYRYSTWTTLFFIATKNAFSPRSAKM